MNSSQEHKNLSKLLLNYFVKSYGAYDMSETSDSDDSGIRILDVVPDVYCIDSIGNIFIGEAKTENDIENDHTRDQFISYLKWGSSKKELDHVQLLIVYAVPYDCLVKTRHFLTNVQQEYGLNDITFNVITPLSQLNPHYFDYDLSPGRVIFKNESPPFLKIQAFEYQKQAVEKIKDLEYAAIFHEQGLGKTKIAIDLMVYWLYRSKIVDTVIIVTKKSLVSNWCEELKIHTNLKPDIINLNMKNNFYVFNRPNRIIITSFEVFKKEESRFKLFAKCRPLGIILDESTKIKNPETGIAKSLLSAAPLFLRRVIMSGTPIANRPYDIWSQIYFLDNGKSLGDNYQDFKKKTDLSNDLSYDEEKQKMFVQVCSTIMSKISSFTVRETKNSGILNLPPKYYHTITVNFEIKQKEMYDHIRNDLSLEIIRNGELIIDDSSEIVKRLTRLIQVTSNPALIDSSYIYRPAKMNVLLDLLDDIDERGEKVIVWTSFIENVKMMMEALSKYHPVSLTGKMAIDERDVSIEKFKNNPSVKVLIATTAAKEGLTLTVANNAIFYDRTLNLDDYLQAQDRIHRISQKKECHIYNIKIVDSIDEWIDSLVNSKDLSAKMALGDITKEEYNSLIDYSFGSIVCSVLGGNND